MITIQQNITAHLIPGLCILVGLLPFNHAQLDAQQTYQAQRVVLANGDRLPVKLQRFQDKLLEFGSPLFFENVSLEQKRVKAIQFESSDRNDSTDRIHSLRLRNGTQLSGVILEFNETQCVLNSLAVGKVTIPTKDLLEVHTLKPDDSSQEAGHDHQRFSGANWFELGSEFWLDTRGWISLARKTVAKLEPILHVDSRVGFEFQVDENTNFQWTVKLDGTPTHSINIAKGSIAVESNDQLSFSEFSVEQNLGFVGIQLKQDELHILDRFGQLKLSIPQPKFTLASMELVCDSGVLQIREFTIDRSASLKRKATQLGSTRLAFIENEAEPFQFEQLSFDQGQFVLVDRNANSRKIKALDMDSIWLGVSDLAADSPKNNFVMIWPNGDRLNAKQVEFHDTNLSIIEGELDVNARIVNVAPAIVCFPNQNSSKLENRKVSSDDKSFRLSIGGVPFDGEYSWGKNETPIRWKFEGLSDPVSLNVNRKIEIRRKSNSPRSSGKHNEDRLLLRDGAIIPCTIEVVNDSEISLKSDVTPTHSINRQAVKGIFFEYKTVSNTLKRITKESISRALRVPRFAENAEYTHVLLAANGDLLRGRLIRLDREHIIFETYLQKAKIARSKVLGVIALDELAESSRDRSERAENTGQEDEATVQIDCGQDFKAVGKYVSLDSDSAILESPTLGRLQVKESQIRKIAFNSPLNDASLLDSFANWKLDTAIEPRWTEDVPIAPEAQMLLGQVAPELELPVLGGKEHEQFILSDHLGKVVILNFWATHSMPCEQAMPVYLDVVKKFSPDEVVFVAVSLSEPGTQVSRVIKGKKWNGGKFLLDSENIVGPNFAVSAVPHLAVIDKQGKIQFIKVGYSPKIGEELTQKIETLLAQ